MATERRPPAHGSADSASKQLATDGSSRIDGPQPEERYAGTKSAIRDIIRRYRETFERLAR